MSSSSSIRRKPARDVEVGDVARVRGRYRPVIGTVTVTATGALPDHPGGKLIVLVAAAGAGRTVEETYLPGAIIRTRLEELVR